LKHTESEVVQIQTTMTQMLCCEVLDFRLYIPVVF